MKTTIAIDKTAHGNIKEVADAHSMELGACVAQMALYFKLTGLDPNETAGASSAFKKLERRILEKITVLMRSEANKENDALEKLFVDLNAALVLLTENIEAQKEIAVRTEIDHIRNNQKNLNTRMQAVEQEMAQIRQQQGEIIDLLKQIAAPSPAPAQAKKDETSGLFGSLFGGSK